MGIHDIAIAARTKLADPENKQSFGSRLRRRRWRTVLARFPQFGSMKVLDLGGTVDHWRDVPVRPAALTLVNLFPQESVDPSIDVVVGDACDPPDSVRHQRFDLVYSNSVLEHVGGHARRADMATAVLELGQHHWIQTPYRYFPLEPHWLFPWFQHLPVAMRARITELWPVGFYHGRGRAAVEEVLNTELIGRTELGFLFPGSEIVEERVAGLVKSLSATA